MIETTEAAQDEIRQVDNIGQLRYKIPHLPVLSASKFPKAYNALKKEVLGNSRASPVEAEQLLAAVKRYLAKDLAGRGGTVSEVEKIRRLSLEATQRLWNYYTITVSDGEMDDVMEAVRDSYEAQSMSRASVDRESPVPNSPAPGGREDEQIKRLSASLEKFAQAMEDRVNSLATTVQRLTLAMDKEERGGDLFEDEDEDVSEKKSGVRFSTHSMADLRKEITQMAKAEGKTRLFEETNETGLELDEDQMLTVELWLGLDATRLWQSLKTYFTNVPFKFKEPNSSSRRSGQKIREELESKVGLQTLIPRLLKEYATSGMSDLCRSYMRDANVMVERLMYHRDSAQYGEMTAKRIMTKAASLKTDRTTFLKARSAVLSDQVFRPAPHRAPGGKQGQRGAQAEEE